jgi:hypothetical protein
MRIETKALEAFQKELRTRAYKYIHPSIEEMSWGRGDMSVTDPFGNRLTFTHAISTEPGAAADAGERSRR